MQDCLWFLQMSAALSAPCEEGSRTAGSELRPSGGVRGGEVLPAGGAAKPGRWLGHRASAPSIAL